MAEPTDLPVQIFAHRGFSSRRPEMTLAAYREAVAFAAEHAIELGLECDVQFSADDELVCLHDLTLDRTSRASGPVFDRTVAQLREVDFGGRWAGRRTGARPGARPGEDGRLITLTELLDLAGVARAEGVAITLNLETKHPNPRGFAVDDRVAELITARGWQGPGSFVRVISFAPASLVRLGRSLPHIRRTLLLQYDLGDAVGGALPDGIDIAGPDLRLVRDDPGFVARCRAHGNEVHVWTVNDDTDIEFCLELGVTGFTTDYPDRVLKVLTGSSVP